MFGLDPGLLGALLVTLALIITGVSLLVSRKIARRSQLFPSVVTQPDLEPLVTSDQDAVLVIEIGGRIIYANEIARQWFGLKENNPNLDRLARRIKPDEAFLRLCSGEARVRFSLNGRIFEGISHYIPLIADTTEVILINLRRLVLTDTDESQASVSMRTLGIITEFDQAMSATLEVDRTLQAILSNIEALIPSDFVRVSVWEKSDQSLTTYRLSENKDFVRRIDSDAAPDPIGRGLLEILLSNHQTLLISDIEKFCKTHPELPHLKNQIKSYLGMPFIYGDQLYGMLELASFSYDTFHEHDVGLLKLISGQAALALRNSLTFRDMQTRMEELAGLVKLTQASEVRWNTQEFYTRIIGGISPLIQVESIGFLIYDEGRRRLAAQKPFIGLPPDFVNILQVTIPPGSEGETIWLSGQIIVASPAPEDERIIALGMAGLLQAASLLNVVLIPLTSGERIIGYLQVADKLDGSLFTSQDLHKLTIISGQAAIVIENLILVNQSQERVLRSEALRRIASLTGSVATMDEILTFSLRELAHLLRVDTAVILLADESRAELRAHPASSYGIPSEIATKLGRVSMNIPDYQSTVTCSQRPIICDDISKEALMPSMYRLMSEVLGLMSYINVPILIRERGIGEIILGSRKREFFNQSDLILLTTTASQIAAAIEKSSLYTQTDESLQRRVEQLTALTRISRELNTNLELHTLLQLVHAESLRTTQASCGTISLYGQIEDISGECRAFIRVGDDREGILSPVEARVMAFEEPIVVQNYDLPIPAIGDTREAPPHPGIVSSLIVPIPYQEGIAGLIHLHSNHAEHFDTTAVEIVQTLATQAAIAIGNASRYYDQNQRNELLSRRVETIEKVRETSRSLSPKQSLEVSLETIAFGIQESTPFNVVVVDVYSPATTDLRPAATVGLPLDTIEKNRSITRPWSDLVDALPGDGSYDGIYIIPGDGEPYRPGETTQISDVLLATFLHADEKSWHPGDHIVVLLNDQQGSPLGLIRLDDPRDGKYPDKPTLESLEIFASQACFVIGSQREITEMESGRHTVQSELAHTRIVLDAAQSSQPIFLQKELENAVELHNLSQRAQRIQMGLDIADLVNRQASRKDVLNVFGQEALTWLNLQVVIIAEIKDGNPRLVQTFGIPETPSIKIETYLGQRNPLNTTLQNRELLLVENIDTDQNWNGTPLLSALGAKCFICLPILVSGRVDSAVLLIGQVYLPPYTDEDADLFELLSRQVGMTLENLQLSAETNRRLRELNLLLEFSQQVGSLDPLNILRSLVDTALKAVPRAHAGMVILWQEDQEYLVPQVASGYIHNEQMLEIRFRAGQALPGRVFASGEALRVDEVVFAHDYNLPSEYLLIYRDAIEGRLPISSLVVPIFTSESRLGVVILDNFHEVAAFTHDDQDLVTSLTHQTALTLENARLYQASEQRAEQLMALTNVAATITSSLKTIDLTNSLLGQVSSIIAYDTATLWLRQGEQLTVKAAAGFEDSDQRFGLSVAIEDSRLLNEMIETGRPIQVRDVRQDVRFPTLLEPHYLTWLGVPLISKGVVIGVIALEKVEANYYNKENLDALVTFAGQAAVALENAELYEESVRRAAELNEHTQHLTMLNRLSTELSGSLDLEYILGLALHELSQAVHNNLVSVILFDSSARPILHAEEPSILEKYPLVLPESPIFERLHETLGTFTTDDVSIENELVPLLDFLAARSTRSLLILPLAIGNDLHGLLLAHASHPYLFETDEVELARTISNQAAVAIQNALLFQETERLFGETQKRSAELGVLFELGVNITQVLDQNPLIEATFTNVTRLLGADACGLVLVNPDDELELRALDRDELIGPLYISRSGKSFSEYVLKTGEPLFIRDIEMEKEILPVQGYTLGEQVKTWLGVPLMVRGVTMGVLSVQSYQAGAFGETELRLLGQVGNQLAVALDNARLFENAQVYAADMAKRVSERTREVEKEHNRSQTLLRIITELSASLDQDLVLNRTLTILNETIQAQYSLIVLVHPETGELYLRSSLEDVGFRTRRKQKTAWKLSEGLANLVVAKCQPVLLPDLLDDDRWTPPSIEQFVYRSGIAVPLIMGEESLGALLMYHQQSEHFNPDMLELAQTAAKQIAVSINNTQLFNLIRDQAERLGELLRDQHVETSRSQAMLEAVADGVLVTDARMVITLFNASAEKILKMDRKKVLGQSLENFLGLFGKAAHDWVEIIKLWSENSHSYRPGESKSEDIELDDRRVVSVHLSPVLMRSDFLGTVSIFQDITHLVELDRLKSEFVATVSHELRTPMTSIKGYVEILLMGAAGALNDSQVHFLQVVRSNTERLAILVNDLLDISRIEAGRVTLSLQPLDVKGIIQNSLDMITRRSIDEVKPMNFQVMAAPGLPSAYGDRERVQQILDNLVQNAYQYTPEAGDIIIKADIDGEMIRFSVQDNGIGVVQDDHPRVFERFFRGEDPLVLATSGTGLGLSIVKHLVEMHGGIIWFESQGVPGLGSIFSFTIPLYEDGKTDH